MDRLRPILNFTPENLDPLFLIPTKFFHFSYRSPNTLRPQRHNL